MIKTLNQYINEANWNDIHQRLANDKRPCARRMAKKVANYMNSDEYKNIYGKGKKQSITYDQLVTQIKDEGEIPDLKPGVEFPLQGYVCVVDEITTTGSYRGFGGRQKVTFHSYYYGDEITMPIGELYDEIENEVWG